MANNNAAHDAWECMFHDIWECIDRPNVVQREIIVDGHRFFEGDEYTIGRLNWLCTHAVNSSIKCQVQCWTPSDYDPQSIPIVHMEGEHDHETQFRDEKVTGIRTEDKEEKIEVRQKIYKLTSTSRHSTLFKQSHSKQVTLKSWHCTDCSAVVCTCETDDVPMTVQTKAEPKHFCHQPPAAPEGRECFNAEGGGKRITVDGYRFYIKREDSSGRYPIKWACLMRDEFKCPVMCATATTYDPRSIYIDRLERNHNHRKRFCDEKVTIDGNRIVVLDKFYVLAKKEDGAENRRTWLCDTLTCSATITTLGDQLTLTKKCEPVHWCTPPQQ